jgi:hypothetical protein
MLTTRSFGRKISLNDLFAETEPLRGTGALRRMPMPGHLAGMRGTGSATEAVAVRFGCLWEHASTTEKVGLAGGATVVLGAVVMAFVGPAKMMTMYLIGAAVGAGVAAITYYTLAGENAGMTCGEGDDGTVVTKLPQSNGPQSKAACDTALAGAPTSVQAQFKAMEMAIGAAMMSDVNKVVLPDGKTYTVKSAMLATAAEIEKNGTPAAKMIAKCLREDAAAGTNV